MDICILLHVNIDFRCFLCLMFYIFIFFMLKAEMKMFNNADTSVLKHHYEKKVLELEQEKKFLQVFDLRYLELYCV